MLPSCEFNKNSTDKNASNTEDWESALPAAGVQNTFCHKNFPQVATLLRNKLPSCEFNVNPTDRDSTNSKDWESIPAAGKQNAAGDRVKTCLEFPCPPTPSVVRRFRQRLLPEPGAMRVLPGAADDPDAVSALTHGIPTKRPSTPEDMVLRPPIQPFFQQKLQEFHESVYASNKNAPLGRLPEQNLPSCVSDKTTFGRKTARGGDLYKLINPPKTREEMGKEALEGHENYVRSHKAYFVGERINRKYNVEHFHEEDVFGISTPHCDAGSKIKINFQWLDESQSCSQRKNTLDFPPEHTFGHVLSQDLYGAGEIIHRTEPQTFARGPEVQRSLVNALIHTLKMINYQNFDSLLVAFKYYDMNGKGLINKEDIRAVCREFGLDVNDLILDQLVERCDADKDGFIDFVEFANFLTWKDMMPLNRLEQDIATSKCGFSTFGLHRDKITSAESEELRSKALLEPGDLEPVNSGQLLKTVRTIRKPSKAPEHFLTSSAIIGANKHGAPPTDKRTFGIPTIRSDLPAPRIQRISDTTTYTLNPRAADLLHPSLHSLHGVHEEQLFCPRSKEEISEIFRNVGVNVPAEIFEEAWKRASSKQPNGEVCVAYFQEALKEIKAM